MLFLNTKSLFLAIKTIIINNKIKKQIINLNKYYEICNKGILINKKKIKKYIIPKISIISPVYNGEKFILRFLRSIQNQNFEDIEIIFVDDFSKDNTIKIIEDCQKKDKRITLIKQKKNKGTLKSRNIGALKAKGEYLIFPDSDDILSNDILKKCYNIAKRYNYDLIRFIFHRKNKNYINRIFFYITILYIPHKY
jgi:glycosyltransferase involved in cell wall biosynthesis